MYVSQYKLCNRQNFTVSQIQYLIQSEILLQSWSDSFVLSEISFCIRYSIQFLVIFRVSIFLLHLPLLLSLLL